MHGLCFFSHLFYVAHNPTRGLCICTPEVECVEVLALIGTDSSPLITLPTSLGTFCAPGKWKRRQTQLGRTERHSLTRYVCMYSFFFARLSPHQDDGGSAVRGWCASRLPQGVLGVVGTDTVDHLASDVYSIVSSIGNVQFAYMADSEMRDCVAIRCHGLTNL